MEARNLAERAVEGKVCAWCGELGGARRGQGKSAHLWFHVECRHAVETFCGWEREISQPQGE